jgi:hypothetical protein
MKQEGPLDMLSHQAAQPQVKVGEVGLQGSFDKEPDQAMRVQSCPSRIVQTC